ncbi:MAG: hypothetical protein ACQEXN_15820 [Actinomycetota bacterium]
MAYNLKIKSFYLPIVLRGLYSQVGRFASSAAQRAMHDGTSERALDLIETAFEAEKWQLEFDEESKRPVSSPDRQFLRYAAIFGRADLIDHAVAMEEAALEQLRAGVLAPEDDIEGVEFSTYDDAGNEIVLTAAMRRSHYEGALPGWIETHVERRQQAIDHKCDIDTYRTIRRMASEAPGILRTDLAKMLGLDNRTISHLVDQLAATGFLVTGKVGSRVAVWPAQHEDAPTGDGARRPEWEFGQDPSIVLTGLELPPEFVNPARSLNETLGLISLLETAAKDTANDTGPKPTPMDFLDGMVGLLASPEGHITYMDERRQSLAFWDHIDPVTASRILEVHLSNSRVPAKDRKKWLKIAPRHAHVERRAHQATGDDGVVEVLWLLHEVSEPTENSVPVTVAAVPRAVTVEEAASGQGIIWLPKS